MEKGSTVVIRPALGLEGDLRLPGDKSLCHRYALLGAIAEGATQLRNFSSGADCASTLACLRTLGVKWERNQDSLVIHGRGPHLAAPAQPLDCGNSGSTMRMLSGILAAQDFTSHLTGDASLSRRPMARVIMPLQLMGASITAASDGRPPLRIQGARLKRIDYEMPIASAQVKSALLFAGLLADGETRVREPIPTRDHGELALRAFGADVVTEKNAVRIRGGQPLHSIEATVAGDSSSAAFFLCAAALFPGSRLIVHQLLMNPTRARLLDVLVSMGLKISVSQLEEIHGELVGTLEGNGAALRGVKIGGKDAAALIDELPVLAAIAAYTEGGIEIRDARELRVKESDRIKAVVSNLRAMGAEVEEYEDGLKVPGGQRLHGAEVDSCGDHRIAMAFAVAALRAEGETAIRGADAAVISYPGFFDALAQLTQR